MLKDTFCSSPWIHQRISYDGHYNVCRWNQNPKTVDANIASTSIMEFYNGKEMKKLRLEQLSGTKSDVCATCHYEDDFGKLSGRTRQLHKSGVDSKNFELTMRSTPHYEYFKFSSEHNGESNHKPTDLQIDLGNTCNSACIMCSPVASSKLVQDYKKLSKLEPLLFDGSRVPRNWTLNPELVESVAKQVAGLGKELKYVHFLGGETLFDEAFYTLAEKLASESIAPNVIVGTTTNGTIYNSRIENLIPKFKEFHLGISIEAVSPINDYIRYPGKIQDIISNINKFVELRKQHPHFFISLRVTPNVFTIYEFDQLVEFMIEKNVIAESCNILHSPDVMCMELMPDDIRQETIEKFQVLIKKYNFDNKGITNIRHADNISQVISDVVSQYHSFLVDYKVPNNVEDLRFKLVRFLKAFETVHNNNILDYAPRFTNFLRHYGY